MKRINPIQGDQKQAANLEKRALQDLHFEAQNPILVVDQNPFTGYSNNCLAMSSVAKCLNCDLSLAGNSFFYTLARNSYMFGFFCSRDCATSSEYNRCMHIR
jgi:hypothetical protein